MRRELMAFLRDESGATAIEYGLIASGIALSMIAVVNRVGGNLKAVFASISTAVK
jgi:pilus assembly protein Flp/PilA